MTEPLTDLKGRVLTALRWTAAARFTAQLIMWAITLVVIRILRPEDYGLMAMAEVFFALLLLLSTRGLSAALIQAKEVSERQIRQLFGVLLVVNTGLFAILFLTAPLIALYYQEPRVVAIIRVLGIGFVILPFSAIPAALLTREIDFKRKALVELVCSIASAITVLVLAIGGLGVWSLVVGRLLNFALQAIGLNLVRPSIRRPIFSVRAAGALIRFGGIFTASAVLWVIYNRSPVLVAGRFLDSETLGYYAVGFHLATLAMGKVMPLLNQIALPAYSRLQADPAAAGYYFLKVARIAAILAFPVFVGTASVAPEFVRVILGPRYEQAILPLVLLCLAMPFQLIASLLPAAVNGMGRPGIEFVNKLFAVLVMPAAFLIGVQWGLTGLCLAWVIAFPLVLAFQVHRAAPVVAFRERNLLRSLAPVVGATLFMAAVVAGLRAVPLRDALGSVWELVVLVLAGVAAYAGYVWFLLPNRVREVVSTLRR
jgi:O-antigen/teichoic acid export membrane protein